MKLNEFIIQMTDMVKSPDKTLVLEWVVLAAELSDSMETSLSAELDDIYRSMCYVKNNFGQEVLEQSMRVPMLSNEIINGAMMFQHGCDIKAVRKMAEDGTLECGYIPVSTDEVGTLSLVRIGESDDKLLIAYNEPYELIARTIRRISELADRQSAPLYELLGNRAVAHTRMSIVGSAALSQALIHAYNTTSAVGRRITYSPELSMVSEEVCPVLAVQQQKMDFEADISEQQMT